MPYRQLLTIPLSHGYTTSGGSSTWHLSVALVPRLHEDGLLRDYPDWIRWPAVVDGSFFGTPLSFSVVADGSTLPSGAVTVVSPAPQPPLWTAVFGSPLFSAQPVERYRFVDRTTPDLAALDAGTLADGLDSLFLEIARTFPDKAPTVEQVRALDSGGLLGGTAVQGVADYLEPTAARATPTTGPTLEFHEVLNLLRAHPHLLRLLGLVVDLEVSLNATLPSRVRVQTNWAGLAGADARDECPLTLILDPTLWPKSLGDHVETFLPLSDGSRYTMTTTDLVGGAVQVLDYGESADTGAAIAPPALAEAGVGVVHRDLAGVLVDRFTRQRELENEIDEWFTTATLRRPPVYLEDVAMGYRYDVLDTADPTWRSLFQRRTVDGYRFPRRPGRDLDPEKLPDDEGMWSLALMTEGDVIRKDGGSQVQYHPEGGPVIKKFEEDDETSWRVPDVSFRWNGWSAAAPNPGNSLNGDGSFSEPEPSRIAPGQKARFEARYEPVPGTLPMLRYTHTYKLRARSTDLAGVSKGVDVATPEDADSVPVTFRRRQPVALPTTIRREPKPVPGVGDTQTTLVIKAELEDPPGDITPTLRHLFPPRISQPRLELHGLPEGGIDPDSHAFLAERDALSVDDMAIVDPVAGDLVSGDLDANGDFVPASNRPTAVYLVDPTAAGVCLSGAPGRADDVVAYYGGSWPDLTALNVELRAGDYRTRVNGANANRSVVFFMPKGRTLDVEISHAIDNDFIDHFEAFGAQPGSVRRLLRKLVRTGRHQMVSGRGRLHLVHAVRLPILPASFSGAELTVDRLAGNRHGRVSGGITLDRPSTDMIRLLGSWTDPVDDPSLPEPTTQSFVADTTVRIDPDGFETAGVLEGAQLDLIDTRRHTVTLEMDAFSRFRRYFTEQTEVTVPATAPDAPIVLDARGVAARTVQVTGPDGTKLHRGDDFVIDGDTGELTRVSGGSMALDTAHVVRYVPQPVSRSSRSEPFGTETVTFPAAVRPSPPELVEVFPAAQRTVTHEDDRTLIDHDGRVLRVRLARPWWSSGEGEQLGIVLDPGATTGSDLTWWGRDPISGTTLDAGASLAPPTVSDFSRRDETTSLDDLAAHDVRFDPDRGVWEADVLVAATAERPFVRLACARHQPIAVAGLDRSELVHAQPLRLGPRRSVTVKTTPIVGTVFCAVDHGPEGRIVRARVQEADPNISDPDLRWHDVERDGAAVVVELTHRNLPDGTNRHGRRVAIPDDITGEVRVLLEDLEPVTTTDPDTGAAVASERLVYSEPVEIPAEWR